MMELVTLPPAFGMRNVSPFCLKVEMLLAALELPYTVSSEKDPRKAPKGKLPFVIVDGKRIADSELIVEYLDETTGGKVFAGLSPQQKGSGVALSRLAEDHLYWLMVASRWLDDAWWPNIATICPATSSVIRSNRSTGLIDRPKGATANIFNAM